MRRAPIVIAATIAGTAAVIGLNPRPSTSGTAIEAALPAPTRSTASDTIVMGPAVPNRYGTVQVQIDKRGGKIVDVRAIQLPASDGKSASISRYAGPLLKQEVLHAQSAHVDGVSGATYTSDGYRTSLQAALDHAQRARTGGARSA